MIRMVPGDGQLQPESVDPGISDIWQLSLALEALEAGTAKAPTRSPASDPQDHVSTPSFGGNYTPTGTAEPPVWLKPVA